MDQRAVGSVGRRRPVSRGFVQAPSTSVLVEHMQTPGPGPDLVRMFYMLNSF